MGNFLTCKDVAWHVDNLSVRMLLWPHHLIPEDDFIDHRHDATLVREAVAALKQFAFVDIIENPRLQINLESWLHQPVTYPLANETPPVAPALQKPLHDELTPNVLALLEHSTRLDLKL